MSATLLTDIRQAEACGCLSPPAVTEGDYAVNQRAEQIIFEVEPGWVTAHVLIKYAGAPESFAWIVPVPDIPELDVSPVAAFGLIDRASSPQVEVLQEDICPTSSWACRYHQTPDCGGRFGFGDSAGGNDAPSSDAGAGGQQPPPVTVIDEQVVGDYQTVTFRADEAQAAVTWLRTNGFIVNQTTSIYMEPYVQANMVFVAAKLVAGAGVDAIKPLKLKYRANFPMVPLVLTAVAAEPNLTVTSFIYGGRGFKPMNHPVVNIDARRLARDGAGRLNYPMVLARTIDEAGGDGFAIEYRGSSPRTTFQNNGCCSGGGDFCGLSNNNQCECPGSEVDAADCESQTDLIEGVELVDELANKYQWMTRITTRVSAEEMTFDPTFEVDYAGAQFGRLQLQGSQVSLQRCGGDVVDYDQYQDLSADQNCAAMYCGDGGRCVQTTAGAACACDADKVAQRFFDLDNQASVTCVPRVATVDLRAGGEILPDACAGVSCGAGSCIDRNGVAVCDCNDGAAAIAGASSSPRCFPITREGATPGAQDYSEALRQLDVCEPAPPTCGEGGWLVKVGSSRPGVSCSGRNPDPSQSLREPGPPPTCDGFFDGCAGCSTEGDGAGGNGAFAAIGGAWVLALVMFRRRRGNAKK
ncbi:MAG: DUF2330 domain-containing protein [Kofleriaceae bacterium]